MVRCYPRPRAWGRGTRCKKKKKAGGGKKRSMINNPMDFQISYSHSALPGGNKAALKEAIIKEGGEKQNEMHCSNKTGGGQVVKRKLISKERKGGGEGGRPVNLDRGLGRQWRGGFWSVIREGKKTNGKPKGGLHGGGRQ